MKKKGCSNLLFNQRGSVHIFVLFIGCLVLGMNLILFILDRSYVINIDNKALGIINELNRDSYMFLDVQYTMDTTDFQITDKAATRAMFDQLLQARYSLDTNFNPLSDSVLKGGTVQIVQWRVVDRNELPMSDGHGRIMMYPGVIAEVILPVKTPFFGFQGTVHKLVTTEIYR